MTHIDPDLNKEQLAEIAPILSEYLNDAQETLRLVKEMLHQGRHAAVARRTLRMIEDRERQPVQLRPTQY